MSDKVALSDTYHIYMQRMCVQNGRSRNMSGRANIRIKSRFIIAASSRVRPAFRCRLASISERDGTPARGYPGHVNRRVSGGIAILASEGLGPVIDYAKQIVARQAGL